MPDSKKFFKIFDRFLEDWDDNARPLKVALKTIGVFIILLCAAYIINQAFKPSKVKESFSLNHQCPDILIQKGKYIYLYNSKIAKIPGVNPIKFNNLEDYVEYLRWQRNQKIRCPVLFFQHSYDTQGNGVYKNRPGPTNLQGGLPLMPGLPKKELIKSKLLDAGHDDPPYNQNLYPGYDPQNQYIGLVTPLDKMYHQNQGGISPSAMDPNWGGPKYTQALVKKGDYKEDNVKIYVPS
jgi:hypothetical protein